MKETPTKLAAYFAVGGAWAVFSGLVGLVGKPGFTTLLAIAKLALGIAFLVSARQFNESLVHSPQKLQCPLWGAGAWMIVWFLAREFGDNSQTGTTLADNVFTLVWFVSVLLILCYLRENVLRLSAAARLNMTAARTADSSVSAHRVWREDRSWDALAGFALVSGALPIILLGYVAQFKLFGRALAFSFYTGLSFLFLLLIVWILVSSALWSVAAVAVWYRRRLGVSVSGHTMRTQVPCRSLVCALVFKGRIPFAQAGGQSFATSGTEHSVHVSRGYSSLWRRHDLFLALLSIRLTPTEPLADSSLASSRRPSSLPCAEWLFCALRLQPQQPQLGPCSRRRATGGGLKEYNSPA